MTSGNDTYHHLLAYTLAHTDPAFPHQHVIDAHTIQCADEQAKPIAVAFALAGLYLHVERGFTGRDVQRVHMLMARDRRSWPRFELPSDRGALTEADVMTAPAGAERDAAIHAWCVSVWNACLSTRIQLVQLLHGCGIT
jgi:hypothetical protein